MIKSYVLIICSSALLIGKSIVINDVYYYSDPTGISLHRPEMDHSETLILAEHDPATNDGSFDFREIVFYIHADPSKNQKYIREWAMKKIRHFLTPYVNYRLYRFPDWLRIKHIRESFYRSERILNNYKG